MSHPPYRTRSDTLKLQRLISTLKERGSDFGDVLESSASNFLSDVKKDKKVPSIPHYNPGDDSDGSSFEGYPEEKEEEDWEWEEDNGEEEEITSKSVNVTSSAFQKQEISSNIELKHDDSEFGARSLEGSKYFPSSSKAETSLPKITSEKKMDSSMAISSRRVETLCDSSVKKSSNSESSPMTSTSIPFPLSLKSKSFSNTVQRNEAFAVETTRMKTDEYSKKPSVKSFDENIKIIQSHSFEESKNKCVKKEQSRVMTKSPDLKDSMMPHITEKNILPQNKDGQKCSDNETLKTSINNNQGIYEEKRKKESGCASSIISNANYNQVTRKPNQVSKKETMEKYQEEITQIEMKKPQESIKYSKISNESFKRVENISLTSVQKVQKSEGTRSDLKLQSNESKTKVMTSSPSKIEVRKGQQEKDKYNKGSIESLPEVKNKQMSKADASNLTLQSSENKSKVNISKIPTAELRKSKPEKGKSESVKQYEQESDVSLQEVKNKQISKADASNLTLQSSENKSKVHISKISKTELRRSQSESESMKRCKQGSRESLPEVKSTPKLKADTRLQSSESQTKVNISKNPMTELRKSPSEKDKSKSLKQCKEKSKESLLEVKKKSKSETVASDIRLQKSESKPQVNNSKIPKTELKKSQHEKDTFESVKQFKKGSRNSLPEIKSRPTTSPDSHLNKSVTDNTTLSSPVNYFSKEIKYKEVKEETPRDKESNVIPKENYKSVKPKTSSKSDQNFEPMSINVNVPHKDMQNVSSSSLDENNNYHQKDVKNIKHVSFDVINNTQKVLDNKKTIDVLPSPADRITPTPVICNSKSIDESSSSKMSKTKEGGKSHPTSESKVPGSRNRKHTLAVQWRKQKEKERKSNSSKS